MATVGISPTGVRSRVHRLVKTRHAGSPGDRNGAAGRSFPWHQKIIDGSTVVAKTGTVATVWAIAGYLLVGLVVGPSDLGPVHLWFVTLSAAILLAALAARYVARRRLRVLRREGRAVLRMLAVGPGAQISELVDRFAVETEHPYVVVGACVEGDNGLVEDIPRVGQLPAVTAGQSGTDDDALVDSVLTALEQVDADAVCLVPGSQFSGARLRALHWALHERGVALVNELGTVDVATHRMLLRGAGEATLVHIGSAPRGGMKRAAKALLDRVVATMIFTALLPMLAVVAVAVRLSSPGPVIYRQLRIGRGGKPFTMLKFRTMCADADARRPDLVDEVDGDAMMFKMRNDPRITPVGRILRKYSLDELPQLVNVIRGDMSLVGPRPPLPEEVEKYNRVEARRLLAVPGMTGLWQVSGRSNLTWEETVRLDLRYVDNWTLSGDIRLLGRTAQAVVRSTGAY